MVDLLERLDILLDQESSAYRTEDYLAPDFQWRISQRKANDTTPLSSSLSSSSSNVSGINEVGGRGYASGRIISLRPVSGGSDHIDSLSRQIPLYPLRYKKALPASSDDYFDIAIKLYEPGTLSMKSMIDLSRGFFTVDQMAEMEMDILRSLSWRVHPPTAYCFTKHILFLLPYTSVSIETRYEILEVSRFLSELSVFDYFFVMHRPSSVGLASILNAMNAVPTVSTSAVEGMKAELLRIPGLNPDSPDVMDCCERLEMLYAQGGYSRPSSGNGEPRIETISPVCVSYGVNPYESCCKESFDPTFSAE
eukprot:CAMPEP_0117015324 /NCGR_PEP_ID=MMETSP0472-20121206/12267_1 /TAXON_ID=693140 ORGANISM="Tiarina fusus, Strain LIS" /NCGR_SAMPLE_ID=MMETSP0472 /ASSEMBLY_ACC=CAM_ASM_000603 /LENGTH=307 /DNA_ID=CAMNT_0004719105 /DNA_START=95 /DNA_END=1020 /DNA_ORIENTATION=-